MRYSDIASSIEQQEDFKVRQRVPRLLQFIALFSCNYAIIAAAYGLSSSFTQFAVITVFALGIVDGLMVSYIQRARDLVLVTEFQNALFASALGLQEHFSLIVRKDGAVAYTDTGFRALYPQFEHVLGRTIEDVIVAAHIPRDEAKALVHLIETEQPGIVVTDIRLADGSVQRVRFSVERIRRPKNFVLVRGRTYVEQRNVKESPQ